MREIESKNNCHIFDINTLITANSKVWIVDKLKPNIPIVRLSKSEFNLIKNGVYKKDDIKFDISGSTYWFNKELIETIKVKCKNKNLDISNLAFSMQEFMNKDIIENNDFTIHIDHIQHLKNTNDDIYIICSRNTKENYESIISKLEEKLLEMGLIIKSFYYISETFYNRDEDDINNKKVRLLIQHSIGLKTDGDLFTHSEVEKYDNVNFYDDEERVIDLAQNSNEVLQFLISNTEDLVKERIKDILRNEDCIIHINKVTFNKVNTFIQTRVKLQWQNLVKKFESFVYKF